MCAAVIYIRVQVYGGVRGGVRGIRLWVVYGVYAGGGISEGIHWWRYTGTRLWVVCGVYAGEGARVYAGGGVRGGIRGGICRRRFTWYTLVEVYGVVYTCMGSTT